jgi:hypothetical protein
VPPAAQDEKRRIATQMGGQSKSIAATVGVSRGADLT